jgi:hypothetical protein
MENESVARELMKIANMLAIKQLEGLNRGDQARLLNAAGFTYAEIASVTGMSQGSIRGHVSLGKKRAAAEEE